MLRSLDYRFTVHVFRWQEAMSEPDSTKNPWTTLESNVRFENPWMRIMQNHVVNPTGHEGEYTVVHFKNRAVGVIPVDDESHTWLVGQYRYAVGSYEWEIVEGGAPEGESVLECAKRELTEETGLVAEQFELILDGLQLSNSITDERAYTFVARGLAQHIAMPEETEKLAVRRLPLEEAFEMALRGEIRDGFSVISLMKLKHLMLRNEFRI